MFASASSKTFDWLPKGHEPLPWVRAELISSLDSRDDLAPRGYVPRAWSRPESNRASQKLMNNPAEEGPFTRM